MEYLPRFDSEDSFENREAQLRQRVIELASNIAPIGDYRMTLSGIGMPKADHKALEALAKLNLVENSSTLSIKPDLDGGLVLDQLEVPLVGPSSTKLMLYHTSKLGYMSAIYRDGKISHETIIPSYEIGEQLLASHNVTPPPASDLATYQLWRSELLDRTKAWKIKEELKVAQQFASEEASSEIAIVREELYSPETFETSVLSTVSNILSLYPINSDKIEHYIEEISSEDRINGTPTFGITQYYEDITRDPFVVNNDTRHRSERQEINLSPDVYLRLDKTLSLAEKSKTMLIQP